MNNNQIAEAVEQITADRAVADYDPIAGHYGISNMFPAANQKLSESLDVEYGMKLIALFESAGVTPEEFGAWYMEQEPEKDDEDMPDEWAKDAQGWYWHCYVMGMIESARETKAGA